MIAAFVSRCVKPSPVNAKLNPENTQGIQSETESFDDRATNVKFENY